MSNINKLVGDNIRNYIKARGKQHTWVIERTGMNKKTFYNLLNGQGDVAKQSEIIAKLFRKDPLHFYQKDMELPFSDEQINQKFNFVNSVAASYHDNGDRNEFLETIEVLDDFIDMIDVLKSATKN
ncbi:hypothetical protein [Priestia megaterium]|uniref:hypothetical protein n=1 Tax=Priestia megaterium TaxID=1404 RepID=UPI003D2C7462